MAWAGGLSLFGIRAKNPPQDSYVVARHYLTHSTQPQQHCPHYQEAPPSLTH